ncbi:MAG: SDR family NAD(P)-dependent oxidoreductase [Chloroflexota bacterium]|nr:SDR family NAD(P)-dependent oxidoreductase [Chloroflexota bacterium]
MRFTNKIALITGAAGGIGSATVHIVAGEAGNVVALDNNEASLQNLLETTDSLAGTVESVLADAFNPASVHDAVDSVIERWGCIDILVNCIGGSTIIPETKRPIEELSLKEWKRVVEFNLDATFLFCREVLPHMKLRGSGKIINISSRSATGLNLNTAAYSASKAGIIALTTRVANEAGPYGINVNAVAPNTTMTERVAQLRWAVRSPEEREAYIANIALRRLGQPEDQAKVIAFLASEDADYISGQTIHVNGGM